MSDTDDTDVLLLIPPDFFLINSDTESSEGNWNERCRYHWDLVENLLGEVGDLKSRVNCIETTSLSSFGSMDRITEPEKTNRNFQYGERFQGQYAPNSTNSTPQKPRTKLVANSLPSTPSTERVIHRRFRKPTKYDNKPDLKTYPACKSHSQQSLQGFFDNDADISSFTSSPEKKENRQVLGEIDQFLSHVKTIKRYVTQKNTDQKSQVSEREPQSLPATFDHVSKLTDLKGDGDSRIERKALAIEDVDKLLQTMEEQQHKMEEQAMSSRIVEGNNNLFISCLIVHFYNRH